jgi:Golgi phosphoprotein 3 (GPP34)
MMSQGASWMTGGRSPLLEKSAAKVFLILHDPFSGKPVVRASAIKRAIMGAELADLILARRIGMENDQIVLADEGRRGADHLSAFLVETIRSQPESHTVPVWVATLADRLFDLLATLLVNDGIVRRAPGPRFLVSADRFPAQDLLAAVGPRLRLEHALRSPEEPELTWRVVAAVIGSIGASRAIDTDGDRGAVRRRIEAITKALPLDLRDLIIGMEVAHASGELPPSLRLHATES